MEHFRKMMTQLFRLGAMEQMLPRWKVAREEVKAEVRARFRDSFVGWFIVNQWLEMLDAECQDGSIVQ